MKRLAVLILVAVMLTGFTYRSSGNTKYTNLGDFVHNLVRISDIEINYIKAPKVSEYFGDIKDSDYYAKSFIYAADSGILSFPQKKVQPKHWIKFSRAMELTDKAYRFVTKEDTKISQLIFKELVLMPKYKKVKTNHYMTAGMQEDFLRIYANKIKEFKNKGNNSDAIKVSKEVEGNNINITLDWGEKPNAGYELKITGAKIVNRSIEVYYIKKSPKAGEMTAQVITHPKDSIMIDIEDRRASYDVVIKESSTLYPDGIRVVTKQVGDSMDITLDWGQKTTGGYLLNITDVQQNGNIIEVLYETKSPAEGDIVTQVMTYPRDTRRVRIEQGRNYDIVIRREAKIEDGVSASVQKEDGYLNITVSWGQKPTGGYVIKIVDAVQVGDTIEVTYTTRAPKPEEMVTQAITFPKDSIKIPVSDIGNKEYRIVLKNVN